MPYFELHYIGAYSVNPLRNQLCSEAPSRGRMDYRTTSAAGLASSRGLPWVGKAAFAVAMLVVTSALAVWVVDFDIVPWLRNPQGPNGISAFSFDDRFGSGSARNAPSIKYHSRLVTR